MGILCERNSSYSFTSIFWKFADVLFMVWRCACGLDIIVKLFVFTFLVFFLSSQMQ